MSQLKLKVGGCYHSESGKLVDIKERVSFSGIVPQGGIVVSTKYRAYLGNNNCLYNQRGIALNSFMSEHDEQTDLSNLIYEYGSPPPEVSKEPNDDVWYHLNEVKLLLRQRGLDVSIMIY